MAQSRNLMLQRRLSCLSTTYHGSTNTWNLPIHLVQSGKCFIAENAEQQIFALELKRIQIYKNLLSQDESGLFYYGSISEEDWAPLYTTPATKVQALMLLSTASIASTVNSDTVSEDAINEGAIDELSERAILPKE